MLLNWITLHDEFYVLAGTNLEVELMLSCVNVVALYIVLDWHLNLKSS